MSDSVWPHRRQPIRLLHPWDSLGKNTGVGCHFLLQLMKVKSESEVAQSCPTLSDPMDWSPSGYSVHGVFQARVLEWGAIALDIYFYDHYLHFLNKKKKTWENWWNYAYLVITCLAYLINFQNWETQGIIHLTYRVIALWMCLEQNGHN